MQETYFEILVEPKSNFDIFMDFLSSYSALEEISVDKTYSISGYDANIEHFDFSKMFNVDSGVSQIILRSDCVVVDELLRDLKELSSTLSDRLGERIDFGFGYRICKNDDWIEKYRESITPIECSRFYIRPSWCKSATEISRDDLLDIVIDPALAFGSGHHESTEMCLKMLSCMQLDGLDMLDVGCGSGILSIAGRLLGANVDICDSDKYAISESKKNFSVNNVSFSRAWVGSIDGATKEYDVIVANIVAFVILMLRDDFRDKLKVGATLILSGILEEYRDEILRKFDSFFVVEELRKNGWVALKLLKNK